MNSNQLYVGLEVSKYAHQSTLIDQRGQILCPSFKFANSRTDFKLLMKTVKKQLPRKTAVTAGLEATGHYYWHLRDHLNANGWPVLVFNPLETRLTAQKQIRKVKNDRRDSLITAR